MKKLVFIVFFTILFYQFLLGIGVGGYGETGYRFYNEDTLTLSYPWYYYQFKLWGNPAKNTDFYSQLGLKPNEFSVERTWIKYWGGIYEILGLIKEERHSVESQVLQIVNPYAASGELNNFAVKFSFWYPKEVSKIYFNSIITQIPKSSLLEWYGSYFVSDIQNYIFKLKTILINKDDVYLTLGTSYFEYLLNSEKYSRKYSPQGEQIGYNYQMTNTVKNKISSIDLSLNLFNKQIFSEIAFSNTSPSIDGTAYGVELRNVNIGNLWLVSKFYNIDKNFRSYLSYMYGKNPYNVGKQGFYQEINYLLPKKMLNFLVKFDYYDTYLIKTEPNLDIREFYNPIFSETPKKVFSYQTEVYTELINNLKPKIVFDSLHSAAEEYNSLMLELGYETKDVANRIQLRKKDIGKDITQNYGEKDIIAVDSKINITKNLQFYVRHLTVFATKLNQTWYESFLQLRYYIGWDINLYLEYGSGWDTNDMSYSWIVDNPYRKQPQVVNLFFMVNLW